MINRQFCILTCIVACLPFLASKPSSFSQLPSFPLFYVPYQTGHQFRVKELDDLRKEMGRNPLSNRASIPTTLFRISKVRCLSSQSLIKQGINSYNFLKMDLKDFLKEGRNPLSFRASIPTAPKIVSQSNQIVKVLRPNF